MPSPVDDDDKARMPQVVPDDLRDLRLVFDHENGLHEFYAGDRRRPEASSIDQRQLTRGSPCRLQVGHSSARGRGGAIPQMRATRRTGRVMTPASIVAAPEENPEQQKPEHDEHERTEQTESPWAIPAVRHDDSSRSACRGSDCEPMRKAHVIRDTTPTSAATRYQRTVRPI